VGVGAVTATATPTAAVATPASKVPGFEAIFAGGIAVDSLCDGVQKEGEKKRMKKEILRRGIFYFLPLKGCGSV